MKTFLTGVDQPVLLCLWHTCKPVKCCGKDNVQSGPQLRVQLLTLGRRVKVQRAPGDDRCPLSSTQSISAHSCLSRWRLWEIVFSGMFGLWSLGVWTWKKSNNKSVAGLTFIFFLLSPPITGLLSSLLSLWCPDYIRPVLRNPPHVGSFSSLAAFFCVNISFLDQVLFSLTVYRDFILCESVFFCPFQRNCIKM